MTTPTPDAIQWDSPITQFEQTALLEKTGVPAVDAILEQAQSQIGELSPELLEVNAIRKIKQQVGGISKMIETIVQTALGLKGKGLDEDGASAWSEITELRIYNARLKAALETSEQLKRSSSSEEVSN